jgi:hypothetical protein
VRRSSVEGAARSTSAARHFAEGELHRLVASRFGRRITGQSEWYKRPELRAQIVAYLNASIERDPRLAAVYLVAGRQGVTEKWLGWKKHRAAIEAAIKEHNNA